MKTILFTVTLIPALFFAQTRKPYEIFYLDSKLETTDARVVLVDITSQKADYIKGKLKITNNSDYVMILKPKEFFFKNSNGSIFNAKDKDWWFINPGDTKSHVVGASGMGETIHNGNVSFNMKGYYLCKKTEILPKAENLLEEERTYTIGDFSYSILDIDEDSKGYLNLKCRVTYNGNKVGIATPSNIKFKPVEGKIFVNERGKNKELDEINYPFHKGEDRTFKLRFSSTLEKTRKRKKDEMQSNNMLVFENVFTELTPDFEEKEASAQLTVDKSRTYTENRTELEKLKDAAIEIKDNTNEVIKH